MRRVAAFLASPGWPGVHAFDPARPLVPPHPRGFRAEDFTEDRDGFLPLAEAASGMGVSEDEVLALAGQGKLEALQQGGSVYVRPALVTVLSVEG